MRMARMAREDGPVAALESFMANDALVFAPTATSAKTYLGNSPVFPPTDWQVHSVISSCDGTLAITQGAITWGETPGRYVTVWQRQPRGRGADYRWVLSDGDGVEQSLDKPDIISTRIASCDDIPEPVAGPQTDPADNGRATSVDGSLRYEWWSRPDGSRDVIVEMWDGANFEGVVTHAVRIDS